MNKYKVKVLEVHAIEVEVEAHTPDHAREVANDLLAEMGESPDFPEAKLFYYIEQPGWPVMLIE